MGLKAREETLVNELVERLNVLSVAVPRNDKMVRSGWLTAGCHHIALTNVQDRDSHLQRKDLHTLTTQGHLQHAGGLSLGTAETGGLVVSV